MADNVTLNPGAAGSVIRTLDRTSVETQIVALDLNPAGSETLMAGAMPCSQSGTWNVGTLATITNSVTVVNAGTFAVQAAQSGTWNVGTVTTVSAVTSITNALPAGTNILGIVSACNETNTIFDGTTPLTPKFAAITASASGDTSIVSAVTGKKIRVMRWSVSSSGTVNIKWRNGTTDITGLYYMVANATVGGGYCPVGHFETSSNSALQVNLSGATAVGGVLTYIEV